MTGAAWKPGDRLLCIRDNPPSDPTVMPWYRGWPVVGRVYTLRGLALQLPAAPEPGCYLREIYNRPHPVHGLEYGYLVTRFVRIWTSTRRQRCVELVEASCTERGTVRTA